MGQQTQISKSELGQIYHLKWHCGKPFRDIWPVVTSDPDRSWSVRGWEGSLRHRIVNTKTETVPSKPGQVDHTTLPYRCLLFELQQRFWAGCHEEVAMGGTGGKGRHSLPTDDNMWAHRVRRPVAAQTMGQALGPTDPQQDHRIEVKSLQILPEPPFLILPTILEPLTTHLLRTLAQIIGNTTDVVRLRQTWANWGSVFHEQILSLTVPVLKTLQNWNSAASYPRLVSGLHCSTLSFYSRTTLPSFYS